LPFQIDAINLNLRDFDFLPIKLNEFYVMFIVL